MILISGKSVFFAAQCYFCDHLIIPNRPHYHTPPGFAKENMLVLLICALRVVFLSRRRKQSQACKYGHDICM